MLCAVPAVSGTPSGLLYQVGASTSGLTLKGPLVHNYKFEDEQRGAKNFLNQAQLSDLGALHGIAQQPSSRTHRHPMMASKAPAGGATK